MYMYIYVCICIYMYVYVYICMYICTYICNHEINVPSRLSPQWLYGNPCTWAHKVHALGHMMNRDVDVVFQVCRKVTILFYLFDVV